MREDAPAATLDQDHRLSEVAELMAAIVQAQQEQQHRLDQWLEEFGRRDAGSD